jgi:pyruvate-formate lyase
MASQVLETPRAAERAGAGFEGGRWLKEIDVRDFIQSNITPYHATRRSWRASPRARRRSGTS